MGLIRQRLVNSISLACASSSIRVAAYFNQFGNAAPAETPAA
jgi:hypothetical protein